MSETEFARAERLWSENCRLQYKLTELEEQAQALVSALRKIRDKETCEALNPGFEKYKNYENGWHGVSEFAKQTLEAYEAWRSQND